MRLVTLALVLLALALPSRAQAPPEAYYPLDVGNEWVYTFQYSGPRFLQHDRIVGTETVDGVAYTLRERCDVPLTSDGPGTPACELQRIRFADRDLVVRQPDGSERAEACAVGAPSGTLSDCDDVVGEDFTLEVFQSGPTAVVIGQHVVEVAGAQSYDTTECCIDPPPAGFALGIGRLTTSFNDIARFEYARVRGREYGVHPLDPAPASFDPVAVGTVREYRGGVAGSDRSRQDSPRTLTLDGVTWTLRRRQGLSALSSTPRTRGEGRRLVRFDTSSARVVQRFDNGVERPVYPCSFDVPRGETSCTDEFGGGVSWRWDAVTVGGPADERTTSVLSLSTLGGGFIFVAGIGETDFTGDGSSTSTELVFADVGPLPTGDPLPFGEPLGDAFPTEIDPTPAHQYYPLAVGNEWHYQFSTVQSPEGYHRRRIVGTEVVEGETFFQDEVSTARPGDAVPAWEVVRTTLVRYDSLSARVVTPSGPDERFACPLDEPVNTDPDAPVFCGGLFEGEPGDIAAFRTTPGTVVQQGGLVVPTASYKRFRYYGSVDFATDGGLAAGVGLVYEPGTATTYAALEYARVQQDDGSVLTLGAPLPVDAEADAVGAAFAVTAAPNPTAGALSVTVEMPTAGPFTAEAFDALGRRVWRHAAEAAPGPSELRVDAGAWAPGVYLVRVRAGERLATARVVRR